MSETPRRKEGMQRVQVGLTGLFGIMLLVGLANLVVDKVRDNDAAVLASGASDNMMANAGNAESMPTEPLAELGVTPAAEPSSSVVADLEPDPRLRKPMDRGEPAGQRQP